MSQMNKNDNKTKDSNTFLKNLIFYIQHIKEFLQIIYLPLTFIAILILGIYYIFTIEYIPTINNISETLVYAFSFIFLLAFLTGIIIFFIFGYGFLIIELMKEQKFYKKLIAFALWVLPPFFSLLFLSSIYSFNSTIYLIFLFIIFLLIYYFISYVVYIFFNPPKNHKFTFQSLLIIVFTIVLFILSGNTLFNFIANKTKIGHYKAKLIISKDFCKNIDFNLSSCLIKGEVLSNIGKYTIIKTSTGLMKIPNNAIAMEILIDNKNTIDRNKKNIKSN